MTLRTVRWTLLAALVVALMSATNAQAGKYHVYSCRTPSGAAATVDGWSGSTTGVGTSAESTCATGGALVAGLSDAYERTANTSQATWALEIPSPETLAEATFWRAGDTAGGAAYSALYEFWFAGPSETSGFGECVAITCPSVGNQSEPLAAENRLEVPSAHLGAHLYMSATCGGGNGYSCTHGVGDEHGYAAVSYLYAANLVLEQNEGPSVKEVGGPLATEKVIHGTSDLTFNATDPGAGVYQAVFSLDGKVVEEAVLNENSGHCKNVGETTDGLPAFLYRQPCLKSVSADVGLDTTKISNGRHHIVVTVTDPAGNVAYALDREVEVFNPGGLVGYFWRVGGAELESGAAREFAAQDEYPEEGFRFVGKFDNKEVRFVSKQLKVSDAVITGGKPGRAKGMLTLEHVSVLAPAKCEGNRSEIVTTLAGELVQSTNEAGTEAGIDSLILAPASGTVFAEMTLEGSKCAFAGDKVVVEGDTLAELFSEEELKSKNLGFYATSAKKRWYRNSKGELGATELKIGSKAAVFEGTAEMSLVSKEAFGAF
jgi:hypothetical protein